MGRVWVLAAAVAVLAAHCAALLAPAINPYAFGDDELDPLLFVTFSDYDHYGTLQDIDPYTWIPDASTLALPSLTCASPKNGGCACAKVPSLSIIGLNASVDPEHAPGQPIRVRTWTTTPANFTTGFTLMLVAVVSPASPDLGMRYYAFGCDGVSVNGTPACALTVMDLSAVLLGEPDAFSVRSDPVALLPSTRYDLAVRLYYGSASVQLTTSNKTVSTFTEIGTLSVALPLDRMGFAGALPTTRVFNMYGLYAGNAKAKPVCVGEVYMEMLNLYTSYKFAGTANTLDLFDDGAMPPWLWDRWTTKFGFDIPMPIMVNGSVCADGPAGAQFVLDRRGSLNVNVLVGFTPDAPVDFAIVLRVYNSSAKSPDSETLVMAGCRPGRVPFTCVPFIYSLDGKYAWTDVARTVLPNTWYRFQLVVLEGVYFAWTLESADGLGTKKGTRLVYSVSALPRFYLSKVGFVLRNPLGAATPGGLVCLDSFQVDPDTHNKDMGPPQDTIWPCPPTCVCVKRSILSCGNITMVKTITSVQWTKYGIQWIAPGTFDNATHLVEISLDENMITNIPPNLFSPLKRLTVLDLTANNIHDLSFLNYTAPTLQFLMLGQNSISALPDCFFSRFPSLKVLYINNNFIESLTNTCPMYGQKLSALDASDNRLGLIPPLFFNYFTMLTTIRLTNNAIRSHGQPIASQRYFFWMELSGNGLTEDDVSAFFNHVAFTYLHLNHNNIRKLSERLFLGITYLQYLYLAYNKIETVPVTAFKLLPTLGSLDLSHNLLTDVADYTFHQHYGLNPLELSNNRLRRLPPHVIPPSIPSEGVKARKNPGAGVDMCSTVINNCVPGTCAACFCMPGFTGPSCNVTCPAGTYGSGCLDTCDCGPYPCNPETGCVCDDKTRFGPRCELTAMPEFVDLEIVRTYATAAIFRLPSCSNCSFHLEFALNVKLSHAAAPSFRAVATNLPGESNNDPLATASDGAGVTTVLVATVNFPPGTTEAVQEGLLSNSAYLVSVAASIANVSSPASYFTFSTLSPSPPAAPSGLSTRPTPTTLTFAWSTRLAHANGTLSGYRLSLRGPGGFHRDVNVGFLSQFVFENLSPSTDYEFSIAAVNAAGESPPATLRASTTAGTDGDRVMAATGSGMSQGALAAAIAVPTVVICGLAFGFALFAMYRRVALARSRETHEAFLQEHMARQSELKWLEIDRENVELHGRLGEGEFGVVCQGQVFVNGAFRICAVKTLKEGASLATRKEFVAEACLMRNLTHPNVLGIVAIVTASEPMLLCLEFAPYGSLRRFVEIIPSNKRRVPTTTRLLSTFALQIATGMEYLASLKVVHRDLAARNVLVGQDGFGEYVVKIADFGMSRRTQSDYYRKSGGGKIPAKWCAPESLARKVFTEKTDVWSWGVTVWEMFSFGESPFAGVSNSEIYEHVLAGHRLSRPDTCPRTLYELLRQCWDRDPDKRPTFTDVADAVEIILAEVPVVINDTAPPVPLGTIGRAADALAVETVTVPAGSLGRNSASKARAANEYSMEPLNNKHKKLPSITIVAESADNLIVLDVAEQNSDAGSEHESGALHRNESRRGSTTSSITRHMPRMMCKATQTDTKEESAYDNYAVAIK